MIVEPFRSDHLRTLIAQGVQPAQSKVQHLSDVSAIRAGVERVPGTAMTIRHGEQILLCGGLFPEKPKVGILWAVLSASAGAHMLAIHRITLRFLDIEPLRRIEATTEDGHTAGCRWLEMLGFQFEGRMRAYGPGGETHLRYSRVR